MKKLFLSLLTVLLPLVAFAGAVEIDGIYYNLISKAKEAEVTRNPNYYRGCVDIPASVTFEGIDYSVTTIGNNAFIRCAELTSVTFPNSITSIGEKAFDSCSSLSSITIPNSITSIGVSAYNECINLTSVKISDISTWCAIVFSNAKSNPLFYAKKLYLNGEEIKELIIPNSVTSIGDYAFYNCSSLSSIIIPNSVTMIGSYSFHNCNGLTSITFPNSITEIGGYAFSTCGNLTSVTIPNSVTSIGEYAFFECSGLNFVNITDIAKWCNIRFSGYNSNPLVYANKLYLNGEEIKELIIPNSVTSIGDYAFFGCSLTSATIPNSVTWIGTASFSNCLSLTSIIIPNSVTSIQPSTFSHCSCLTSVTIPNSVTSLGDHSFASCRSLTSITIPNSVTSIGEYTFMDCSNLTSIDFGNNVMSIGSCVFNGCISLTAVTIPNSVTSLGSSSFEYCSSLASVTIGSSVKSISRRVFAFCPELADVYCLAESVPSTFSDAFEGSYIEYAALHVPANSINAYKSTVPWKNFMSIVSLEGDTPETPKCATPIISYQNGQLIFESETEGVEFVSEITDTDIKKHYDAKVSLTATYNITVYATKTGYDNSDVATATLCWIDQQPRTEGITDGLAQIPACPVLIKTDRGRITVEGIDDQTNISLFTTDGKLAGSAISQNGSASIDTHLPSGTTAIIKIGEKSVKVLVK